MSKFKFTPEQGGSVRLEFRDDGKVVKRVRNVMTRARAGREAALLQRYVDELSDEPVPVRQTVYSQYANH